MFIVSPFDVQNIEVEVSELLILMLEESRFYAALAVDSPVCECLPFVIVISPQAEHSNPF